MMNYDLFKPVMDSILGDKKGSFNKAITKGKSVKIGNRIIYPIIIFSTFKFKDKVIFESITPFAIAVIEPDQKYFISLDEENEEIKELLNKDSLWDELDLKY